MNSEASQLAPLPDHGNTTDPLWLALWSAYEPVITPLRRMPLIVDIELCGGMFGITAELSDYSYLLITSDDTLPTDPNRVRGWHVQRLSDHTPTIRDIVYDSTEGGPQAAHGNDHVPLFHAITTYVARRGLGLRFRPIKAVSISGLRSDHSAIEHICDCFPSSLDAVTRYHRETVTLRAMGWRPIHQQGGNEWPLSVWVHDGAVVTVAVTLAGWNAERAA
ncbi:hypothetical protein OG365_24535 [Streptomyces sp. NBC_00853]|uniref:hypothetical protein n=1 Tax=Streptomyces sp. NBC_00853 TaxID=2903681 RepID=UPI0038738DC7|nr:hypothetical protein OG365_24535 [Streptomyces sp. NBC_00853]